MKPTTMAAIATPVIAAAVIASVLVATHHTAVPPLTPAAVSPTPHGTGTAAGPARCERAGLARPFTGIAINPQIGEHVKSFEAATGSHVQVVEFYNAFDRPFQRWEAQQATVAGALPLIQLNPRHVSVAQIAKGRYDAMIKRYARDVRAFRCQVILSFGHEMNGWWYPWGRPHTTPAAFIAAWRHIHDLFAAEHVRNVIWSWDPTHQFQHKSASFASQWYPGNAYVDWVGVDGYLGHGQNFADIFAKQLQNIRSVSDRPVFLAETGVAGGPGQSWQIANLFAALKKYNLTGFIWFDLNRKQPWRLEGRPGALAAFRKAEASLP